MKLEPRALRTSSRLMIQNRTLPFGNHRIGPCYEVTVRKVAGVNDTVLLTCTDPETRTNDFGFDAIPGVVYRFSRPMYADVIVLAPGDSWHVTWTQDPDAHITA